MESFDIVKELPQQLLDWYIENRRALPWRADTDPYHVWISEIMLQQTRVEAVKGYYSRFLQTYPNITALANADEQQLHKLWEGLGYYSRVRNLKKAAQCICSQYHGQFPREYAQVLALPGIGDYTAGAVCSISFGLPTPAVDGNVLRVLSRLLTWQDPTDLPQVKRQARQMLQNVYPEDRPGDFTQALMELGATVCLPNGAPRCDVCPMAAFCLANANGTQREYPRRLEKKPRKQERKTIFLISCCGKWAVCRREETGLLAGLWQFPNVPNFLDEQQAVQQLADWGAAPRELLAKAERTHIFTHIQWQLRAYHLECGTESPLFTWMTSAQIQENAALPTAFRQFWDLIEKAEDPGTGA